MTISIFTLHSANNIGAFLQAFSLQRTLQNIYADANVELVKFPERTENASKLKKALNLIKEKRLGKLVFKYKSVVKYKQVSDLLSISAEPFCSENTYDRVVVGSDEVWNIKSNTFIHHPQFFGKEIKADRIISYAASANDTILEELTDAHMDFESFDAVSVRDENTFNLVGQLGTKKAMIVCDPTLLVESYDEYMHPVNEKNYILVYSYGLEKDQIKQVKAYAKKHRKKILSIGTYNSWCDKNLAVDPIEFLSWLKYADLVVTSTFHGTVLSVKHHKNVAVFSQGSHKVNYFLKQMNLQGRDIKDNKALEEILDTPIDYESVDDIIRNLRAISIRYLKEALGEVDK